MKATLTIILFILNSVCCFAQSAKDSLYVFVGEKVSVERVDPAILDQDVDTTTINGFKMVKIYMDDAYKAKYRVIKNVYNHLDMDTITFDAFDHYGAPAFSKYKYVLLFVSKGKARYYHQKYQYFDVYPTDNNKWASPGDPYRFGGLQKTTVKPVPVKFRNSVVIDLLRIPKGTIALWYHEPYFLIKDNKATALMGVYIDDLFKVKKEGVLKNRGIF